MTYSVTLLSSGRGNAVSAVEGSESFDLEESIAVDVHFGHHLLVLRVIRDLGVG